MKFPIRPCSNCPFKKGQGELFGLHPERLEEIKEAPAFQCHKTLDMDKERFAQCAGLITVLFREGKPNQISQIAERLGVINLDNYDPDHECYDTWQEVKEAHERG